MKIYFASDHAGFNLKNKLISMVKDLGYNTEDLGPSFYDPNDDYPIYIARAAEIVSHDPKNSRAIILGASGEGEDMVADKFPAVRSAEFYGGPLDIVRLSREHNDANVLSLGANFISEEEAKEAVKIWLETPFSKEERHIRRLGQIEELEKHLHKNLSSYE
ncbi:MAG TPA: RpiB/LacA/LacB family sugar-phosphate isomerase [Candidatus Paceibacterota bacterium]